MKQFNSFLVLVFALLTTQWASAQCTGTISSSGSGATFTFTSTNPTSAQQYHSWDFGDGTYGSGQTTSHTYSSTGSYTVTAYFGDSINMCSDIDTLLINAIVSGGSTCSAAFNVSGSSPSFTFTPTGTPTAPPGYYSYDWDFGDGTIVYGNNNPTHTYTANGTYTVMCTFYDSIWCTDSAVTTVVVTGAGAATCNSTFTYVDNNGTVTFTPTHPFPTAIYSWNFGDGTSSSAQNPIHTYASGGTYNVWFQISEPNGCFDSILVSIQVGSIPTCDASFNVTDSLGVYHFVPNVLSPSISYTWILSNGAYYTTSQPVIPISTPGTYVMCLEILDSLTMCMDSSCVSFTVPPVSTPICDASFTSTNVGSTYTFTPNVLNPVAIYSWTFGDGSSSTAQIPTHTYTANGTYLVSCNRIIPNQCNDTIDTLITINNIPTTGSISGVINMGNTYADYGVVFLIAYDSGLLSIIDTTLIDSMGMYFFSNIPFGTYLVKAALSPGSVNFASYLPSYYNSVASELLWSNASDVILSAPYLNNIDIDLIAGTNLGGPGFVGGLVSQGANKTGDPISDINVLIFDQNNNPVAYTYSDNTGSFQISNLGFGTYTVYPEVEGRITTSLDVVLSATNVGVNDIRIEVNTTTVEASIATGLGSELDLGNVRLFPNPVVNNLTVQFGKVMEGEMIISVLDVTGKLLSTSTKVGANEIEINTSNLQEGIYILTIENNGKVANYKFVK